MANPSGSSDAETYIAYSHTIDLTSVFNNTEMDQNMTYSTSTNFPAFITHDLNSSNVLTLSGTPELGDVGSIVIELQASDG